MAAAAGPLTIRTACGDDAEAIAAIYAPVVESTAISFELEPPSPAQVRERIARLDASGHPWLVAESSEGVIAYAFAIPYRPRPAYRWSVESSICVRDGCRGRGIGRQIYGTLLRVLERAGMRSVYAAVVLPNDASQRLHRRLGFTEIGIFRDAGFKLGSWRDVQWWQRQIGERRSPPHEPARAVVSDPNRGDS